MNWKATCSANASTLLPGSDYLGGFVSLYPADTALFSHRYRTSLVRDFYSVGLFNEDTLAATGLQLYVVGASDTAVVVCDEDVGLFTVVDASDWPAAGYLLVRDTGEVMFYQRDGNILSVQETHRALRGTQRAPVRPDYLLRWFPFVDVGWSYEGTSTPSHHAAPAGVAWSTPLPDTAINLPELPAGAALCVWLRRQLPEGIDGAELSIAALELMCEHDTGSASLLLDAFSVNKAADSPVSQYRFGPTVDVHAYTMRLCDALDTLKLPITTLAFSFVPRTGSTYSTNGYRLYWTPDIVEDAPTLYHVQVTAEEITSTGVLSAGSLRMMTGAGEVTLSNSAVIGHIAAGGFLTLNWRVLPADALWLANPDGIVVRLRFTCAPSPVCYGADEQYGVVYGGERTPLETAKIVNETVMMITLDALFAQGARC